MRTFQLPSAKDVHFDIDDYLNRVIPASPLYRLPSPIARFFGYRQKPAKEIGNVLVAFWALFGAFWGLCLVGGVLRYSPVLQSYHPPVLFASLGATAILDYNTIQSPLAQPRASLVGHGLAATVGVSVAKLFRMNSNFIELRWIAGPLSCGIASFVMTLTNTIHPPGGATALLAVVDPTIVSMGWMFIPFILLGSVFMLLVALLVNNIQRQFPVFWWTPRDVRAVKSSIKDIESSGESSGKAEKGNVAQLGFGQMLVLSPDCVLIPEGFPLDTEQREMLEELRDQLSGWASREQEGDHSDLEFGGSEAKQIENTPAP